MHSAVKLNYIHWHPCKCAPQLAAIPENYAHSSEVSFLRNLKPLENKILRTSVSGLVSLLLTRDIISLLFSFDTVSGIVEIISS